MSEQTTATAISEYSVTAAALSELAARMGKVVYDVSTPKGMAAARADRAEVKALRVALEKKRVEIKAPALKRAREIDTEAARITAELLKFETPADDAIKAEEARLQAIKDAAIAAEQKRMTDLQERIREIGFVPPTLTASSGSKLIREHIADKAAFVIDESFQELQDHASVAQADAFTSLELLLAASLEHEEAVARIEFERVDFERKRAEQTERDRIANEAHAAAEAVAKKKRDDETAAQAEQLRKDREKFELEQAAVRERDRVANERIAAQQAETQRALDEANAALQARQQAERDEAARKEREAKEAADKRERDAEEQARLNFKPTLEDLVAVVATHFEREDAIARQWIVEAVMAQ